MLTCDFRGLCCIHLQTVILSHLLVNFSHKQSSNEGEVSVGKSQHSLQLYISAPLCITVLMRHTTFEVIQKYVRFHLNSSCLKLTVYSVSL